ncbi:hypothetical protein, partial [Cryptosporangium minutisporangium]
MRVSNKEITVVRSVTSKIPAATEHLTSINNYKEARTLVATVKYHDRDDLEIGQRTWYITGENYDLLMSESPDFAPGKPENEYREVDIWYII